MYDLKYSGQSGPIGIIDPDLILGSDDMGEKVRQVIQYARLEVGFIGRWTGYPSANYRWTWNFDGGGKRKCV
jgi:hypothetical protein